MAESRPVEPSRPQDASSVGEAPHADSGQKSKSTAIVKGIIPRFIDVALEVGVEFTFHNDAVPGRYFLPEVMGGGVAWIDVDTMAGSTCFWQTAAASIRQPRT